MRKLALFALAVSAAFVSTGAFAQTTGGTFGTFPPGTVFQPGTVIPPGAFPGGVFPGFPTTIQRGFAVPPMFLGPQFQINNWQNYGFAQPPAGHRWIRYNNDAYMVDANGRVVDTRSGLDWDQYGERWGMQNGIPHYEGRGDFHPDQRDYAWVQQYGGQRGPYGGYANAGQTTSCGPGCSQVVTQMPQGCGGYTYGCGYGYGYPMIIETTVTTTGGCGCTSCCEEVIEEVVEVREVPRRRVYRAPRPRPRPRPPAGERG